MLFVFFYFAVAVVVIAAVIVAVVVVAVSAVVVPWQRYTQPRRMYFNYCISQSVGSGSRAPIPRPAAAVKRSLGSSAPQHFFMDF